MRYAFRYAFRVPLRLPLRVPLRPPCCIRSYFEATLQPALRRAGDKWAQKNGGHERWVGRLNRCASADKVAELLLQLEERIHALQVTACNGA